MVTLSLETQAVLIGLFGLLVGLLAGWIPMRRRISALADAQGQLQTVNAELETRLAVAAHELDNLSRLKTELEAAVARERSLHKELRDMAGELARERERAARVEPLSETVERLQGAMAESGAQTRELQTLLAEERKRTGEKLALLDRAKAELSDGFQVLAQEILDQKGKIFSEQSRSGLKSLLDPFRDQLNDFKQKVDSVYVNEAKERVSLKKEIEALRDLNRQMSQEAVNLTRALKGDKKIQGTWGEMILERVLEQSGLRKGVEYRTQGGFRDAEGRLLKPDVVVRLPEGKDLVIDSKVSLAAYERGAVVEDDADRERFLAEHVRAVRTHIDTLSAKDYGSLPGLRSLDLVLMFMPIEAAFVAAFRADEGLFSYAFERRIVVVTPSTLLATLKTIENIWRYERQNRSAQAIFARASAIYDKLRLFVESMERLGKQVETVHGTYEEAMGRLVRGKGNVISQLSRFSALGVSVRQPLPDSVTELAEIDPAPIPEATGNEMS